LRFSHCGFALLVSTAPRVASFGWSMRRTSGSI
jgi:hypothetical protein